MIFDIYKCKIPSEGELIITQAPSYYVVKKINQGIYQYQSQDDFSGIEQIVIESKDSKGDSELLTGGYYKLNLVVK